MNRLPFFRTRPFHRAFGDPSGGDKWKSSKLFTTLGLAAVGLTAAVVCTACGDDDGGHGNGNVNNDNTNGNDGGVDAGDAYVDGDAQVPACPPEYSLATRQSEGIYDNELAIIGDGSACNVVDMNQFKNKFYMVCTDNRLLTWDPDSNSIFQFGSLPPSSNGPEGTPGEVIPRSLTMASTEDGVDVAITPAQTENTQNDVKGILYFNEVTDTYDPQSRGIMDSWDLVIRLTSGQPVPIAIGINPMGAALLSSVGTQGQRVWAAIQQSKRADVSTVSDTGQAVGFRIEKNGELIQIDREQTPKVSWWDIEKKRPFTVAKLGNGVIAVPFAGLVGDPSGPKTAKITFFDTAVVADDLTPVRTIDLGLGNNWELVPMPRIGMTADRKNFLMAAVNKVTGAQEIVIQHINNPDNVATTGYPGVQRLDISSYATGPVTNILVDNSTGSIARVYVTERGDISDPDPKNWTPGKLIVFELDLQTGVPSAIKTVKELGKNLFTGAVLDNDSGMLRQPVQYRIDCNAVEGADPNSNAPHLVRTDLSELR